MQVAREIYPFTGRFFERNGLRQHYLDEGTGDPVVMVHGNPSWSIYYRDVVQALKSKYRCIVPDHIGCGLSDKPGDDRYTYTLDRRIDDLEALLDNLKIDRNVTLVLHDWGGMIGMGWATRHPDRVKRIVLLNTAAFRLPASKKLPSTLALGRNSSLGTLLIRGFNAFSRGATRMAVTRRPMPKAVRDAYAAPYDTWANRIATLRFVQDIPLKKGDRAYDTVVACEEQLGQFRKIPVLICWGDKDFVFDRHFLAEWRRHLPEADVHQFADAGHYVLEDAGEQIIPLIEAFLAKHPLAAAAA